ncbi:phage portal protein [Anaerosalibacter sp. Marseille-P3206]|uniref:phage portal protein n=1 Tax=Anaerosalibacter sp. Marseille-P3206 TaxID=1871005 RepID=UPI000986B9D8|nr:phage portal protein [Anaerosalibacter sp. Marseille-P3206]
MIFRRGFEVKNESDSMDIADERLLEWLGIKIDGVNVRGKDALKEATVFACIRILSEAVAKLPIKIYQDQNGIKKATDHYLYSILKIRPNSFMSSFNFFTCLEAQRNTHGNSYANIEYNNKGKIKAIWPMKSEKVEIWIDDKGILNTSNRLWYVVNLDNGKQVKLRPEEVLHFKGFTLDGVSGITPLTYLRTLVQNGKSSEEYINKFFQNGMQTKGIVQYIGDLDQKAEETFRNKFEQMSSGLKNAHRISLLPIGYQFQPISLSMADAQFLENTELTIRQIAAAFGIKMHQLNDLERATHTNISEQQRQFYIDTLMAILTMYEQELTYKLLLDSELNKGYYCKFNVDAITRADIKTRYEAYRIGVQGGFLKPNEVRAREEMESAEGGDALLVNGNMVPITEAGAAYKKKGGE